MKVTSYWLGIDLGTTYTAAAICWPAVDGLEVQVVPLSNRSHAIPSVLYLPGDGSVVVGEGAQRRSLTDPDRVVREFKSRIGDEIPMLVGGSPFFAHDLAAEFASWLWNFVSEREGQHPEGVTLTCPASWGPYKTALFERAVQDAGLNHVTLLGEPQAAAISYASRERVEVGATLAVYDLGGGTFDAAVVRKDSATSFTVLGRPEGIDGLGGVNFDEAIFEHACAAAGVPLEQLDPNDPNLVADVARLRRECTEAKEALSVDTDTSIAVSLGGVRQRVRLTRAEFEEMIRPDLDRTVEGTHRALESAGVDPAQLDAILLVGGSSRIPLVSQLISAEFGRAPAIDEDPKVAVARGAARFSAPADAEESAPATGTLEAPVQFPADEAPPERPEMASMLDADEEDQDSLVAPERRRSRKALLGAAALVLLVLAGGITALRTPALSGLLSHHTTHGTAASSGASTAPSGSAARSGKTKAKATPSGTASGAAQAGSSTGPSGTASSQAKGTKTTKTKATPKPTPGSGGGGGTGGGPVHTQTTPAAPPPTTVPPSTPPPPPPSTDPPTTPPATSGNSGTN
jgi:molecular chaperone DnaK